MTTSNPSQPPDFSSLFASSSTLLTSTRQTSHAPALKRSLRDLTSASSSLGTHQSGSFLSATRLLTQQTDNKFDPSALHRSTRELEFYSETVAPSNDTAPKTPFGVRSGLLRTPLTPAPEPNRPDLDTFLNTHRDHLIESVFFSSRTEAERRGKALVQTRLEKDWETERREFLRESSGCRSVRNTVPSSNAHAMTDPSASSLPLGAASDGRGASASRAAFGGGSTLSDTVRRHTSVISTLNGGDIPSSAVLFGELETLARQLRRSSSVSVAYGNAFQLLKKMTCGLNGGERVGTMARGAVDHLCGQFREFVVEYVRKAVIGGRRGEFEIAGLDGFASDVGVFVGLKYGKEVFWARVYYCLRCGDAASALQSIQSSSIQVPLPILEILTLLGQTQNGHKSLLSTKYSPMAFDQNLKTSLQELLQRSQNRDNDTLSKEDQMYLTGTLLLLTMQEQPVPSNSPLISTIEDYLFLSLWSALHSASTTDSLTKLAKLIHRWGPQHFDDSTDTGGWGYALPLFFTQQFHSGLTHLASTGNLCEATHLGIALDYNNVGLTDLGNVAPTNSQGNNLLTGMLVSYSATFQGADPEAALEYLVRLKDADGRSKKNNARKHIVRLIIETRAFEILAGCIAPDGTREGSRTRGGGGALDVHFEPAEVSSVLADAAEEILKHDAGNRHFVRDGAELLALAGRYGRLLALLNRELGMSLVVKGKEGEERKFWREASVRFHTAHLSQGRTHVIEVLEKEDNLSLGQTFQLLMNLMVFFDRCNEQLWEEAWSILDNLNLLPQSDEQLPFKIESFHSFNNVIQQSFHHILLYAMETLQQQYAIIKTGTTSSSRSSADDMVGQKMRDLRKRAKLIVTFAGLIHLKNGGDVCSRIARMEAFMM